MKKYVLAASALLLSALLCGCSEKSSESKQETSVTTVATTATTTAPTTESTPAQTETLPASSATFYSLNPYRQNGTGPVNKNENDGSYCYIKRVPSSDDANHISALKDKTLEAKVNAWIDTTAAAMDKAFQEALKTHPDWTLPNATAYTKCQNGYLCAQYSLDYQVQINAQETMDYMPFDCRCAFFDMYTGEQLEFSDLFYQDVDFMSYFNNIVATESLRPICPDGFHTLVLQQKREFGGLTEGAFNIAISSVSLPYDNPYFTSGASFYYDINDSFIQENAVFWKPRDMAGMFTKGAANKEDVSVSDEDFTYTQQGAVGNLILDGVLSDSKVLDAAKVKQVAARTKTLAASADTSALLKETFGRGTDAPMFNEDGLFNGYLLYTNVLRAAKLICLEITVDSVGDYGGGLSFCYDMDTLEPVALSQVMERILGANWAQKGKVTPYSDSSTVSAQELSAHMDDLLLANAWKESVVVQYGKNDSGPLYFCISKE